MGILKKFQLRAPVPLYSRRQILKMQKKKNIIINPSTEAKKAPDWLEVITWLQTLPKKNLNEIWAESYWPFTQH